MDLYRSRKIGLIVLCNNKLSVFFDVFEIFQRAIVWG